MSKYVHPEAPTGMLPPPTRGGAGTRMGTGRRVPPKPRGNAWGPARMAGVEGRARGPLQEVSRTRLSFVEGLREGVGVNQRGPGEGRASITKQIHPWDHINLGLNLIRYQM